MLPRLREEPAVLGPQLAVLLEEPLGDETCREAGKA
jgi:hypothetical protein